MARVKIKHNLDPRNPLTKQKLLEVLAKNYINVCHLADTKDGGIVAITAKDEDADSLLKNETVRALHEEGFEPLLPPEVKSRRTILCHGVDQLIYNHTQNDIKEEIEKKNGWAKTKEVFKFPATNRTTHTIKIVFEDAIMATKAEADGLRLFNMSIAYHQIKRETYMPIKTCLRCYKIEEHNTSECPQPREYKVCSECSSHDHTWRNCKSPTKRCLNCDQEHRTLAMKCPKRKEAVKKKLANSTLQGSYAQIASRQPVPTQDQTPTPNIDDLASKMTIMMFCLYNAHFLNAVNPGCFQEQLDYLTSANNLPRMVGPKNPPSADILSKILNNNSTTPGNLPNITQESTQENTQTHQNASKQPNGNLPLEDSTTEISSDSEPEEEQETEGHDKQEKGTRTESTPPTRPTHTIQKKKPTKKHKADTLHRTTTQTAEHKNNSQRYNKTHFQITHPTQDQIDKEPRDPRLRLRTQ